MRKNVLTILLCLGMMTVFNKQGDAQTLIHYWHFNNYTAGAMYTPTINAIPADFTDLPVANARILYTTIPGTSPSFSSYIDDLAAVTADFDTVNARMGEADGNMIRARNPSDSMELLFYIPTTNFQHIVLKYGTESSSFDHGMIHQIFSYSLDSGATWITTGGLSIQQYVNDSTAAGYNDTFRLVTVSITDAGAKNNSKLVFRVTFAGQDTASGASSGNNRFDNITVEGDTISVSESVNQMATESAFTIFPNPVTNIMEINGGSTGEKSVVIYDMIGQQVYEGAAATPHTSINTSNLIPGVYYIHIREAATGSTTTMKFIKQ